jgi:APA family basic amino acid/polyamine antiporter
MNSTVTTERPSSTHETKLVKGLGLLDATTIVMGSMIGSGIFIVAADISRQVNSPGLMMLTWVITAVLTLLAALSFGELAAAMPRAGGQYVYLREAYGPMSGFLYGWTLFTVIQTGTIAAVAVAFARFTGVLFPAISSTQPVFTLGPLAVRGEQLLAIAVILFLTWWNMRGLRQGAMLQNVFTIAKVGALLGFILLGLFFARETEATAANFQNFWPTDLSWTAAIPLVGVALVGSLFSSDAWADVTFTGEEVRNPERNLPLSLGLGVLTVSLLYIAVNWIYLSVLPFDAIQNAPADRVGTAAAEQLLGPIAQQVMAIAIMIATFGCMNGLILAGARVYYAMSRHGLFFEKVGRLHPQTHTPNASLVLQGVWTALLCLSGTYSDLLDYVVFAVLIFYAITTGAVFVLRVKRPDMPRPYKVWGYPILPGAYIVCAVAISLLLLVYKPAYTWPGLGIVLLGVPVYIFWNRLRLASARRSD